MRRRLLEIGRTDAVRLHAAGMSLKCVAETMTSGYERCENRASLTHAVELVSRGLPAAYALPERDSG